MSNAVKKALPHWIYEDPRISGKYFFPSNGIIKLSDATQRIQFDVFSFIVLANAKTYHPLQGPSNQ